MGLLLDTNIILEHLRSSALTALPEEHFFTSAVVVTELLRYPGILDDEITWIDNFLDIIEIIPVDEAIARRAGLLGRTRKTKIPDLLIAASALEHGLTLCTNNIRDFKNIPGLKVKKV